MFAWGVSDGGALGEGIAGDQASPVRLRVRGSAVAAGYGVSAVADEAGKGIYLTGTGGLRSLGTVGAGGAGW